MENRRKNGYQWENANGKIGLKNSKLENRQKIDWKVDGEIGVKSSKLENKWEKVDTSEIILAGKLGWKILSWKSVKKWLDNR